MKNTLECKSCKYFEKGFLSEPNECNIFKEPYEWFIKFNSDGSLVDKHPDWCPLQYCFSALVCTAQYHYDDCPNK